MLAHYDLSRAKRSLVHFGIGRLASALTGFLWLLLAVRVMPPQGYGAFVVALAVLEIFYLVTGVGLSTIAQRYVAEFRVCADGRRLRAFIWRLVAARSLVTLVASAIFLAASSSIFSFAGISLDTVPATQLSCFLVSGCIVRYFDELFSALLLQAYSQSLTILRNLLRIAPLAFVIIDHGSVDLETMVAIETVGAAVAALGAAVLMWRYLLKDSPGDADYVVNGMGSVAARFYLVQMLGQVYGVNVLKLIVSRLLGLEAVAVFGFAQALIDMVRNYLPAHLLAGWIRPLLVSRFVDQSGSSRLSLLAGLVLKVNLLGILPLSLFLYVSGDALGDVLSGGRFPSAGMLFVFLGLLLGLQTAHLLLSMVTLTLARPNANIVATVLACVGLPLSVLLAPRFGAEGVVIALVVAEATWIGTVLVALRRGDFQLTLDTSGYKRLFSGSAVSVGVAILIHAAAIRDLPAIFFGLVPAACFVFLAFFSKPLSAEERSVISKFVPLKFVPF